MSPFQVPFFLALSLFPFPSLGSVFQFTFFFVATFFYGPLINFFFRGATRLTCSPPSPVSPTLSNLFFHFLDLAVINPPKTFAAPIAITPARPTAEELFQGPSLPPHTPSEEGSVTIMDDNEVTFSFQMHFNQYFDPCIHLLLEPPPLLGHDLLPYSLAHPVQILRKDRHLNPLFPLSPMREMVIPFPLLLPSFSINSPW